MKRQIVAAALAMPILFMASACENAIPTQPSALQSAVQIGSGTDTSGVATATAHDAQQPVSSGKAARNSEQLVFSGKTDDGVIGFWIWCEVDSTNPYSDECNGSMYFYALGLTKHVEDVEDGITEGPNETYQIMVHSTIDDSVACTLQNTAEPTHGPRNTVTVSCTSPSVSGVSHAAVVNVTGPGD